MFTTTGFVLISVLAIVTWLYFRQSRNRTKGPPVPGPRGLPFFGSVLSVNVTKMHFSFSPWAEKYGKIFQITMLGQKVVVVNDPALVRKMFQGEEYGNVFFDRPETFVRKYILGEKNDLALARHYGKQTVLFRKMVTKSLKMLLEGQTVFQNQVTGDICGMVKKIDSYRGKDFEMSALVLSSLKDMLFILLTGAAPIGNESLMISNFDESVLLLVETSMNLVLTSLPFLRFLPGLPGKLYKDCTQARDQIYKRLTESSNNANSLYYAFVEYQKKQNLKHRCEVISDLNVKNIILDIISGGVHTLQILLLSAVLVLLNNRNFLKAIHKEIDEVIGRDRKPTLSDKAKMDYTVAYLYETLRYISVGPLGLPHEVSEDTLVEGYHVSKGTILFANIWYMHHDPAIWPEPWEFNPERFLDCNGKLLPPSAECRQNLMSFSFGKRMCPADNFSVGKVFFYLTSLLQTFDFLPPENDELTNPDPRTFKPGLFLMPPSFKCRAIRRQRETPF